MTTDNRHERLQGALRNLKTAQVRATTIPLPAGWQWMGPDELLDRLEEAEARAIPAAVAAALTDWHERPERWHPERRAQREPQPPRRRDWVDVAWWLGERIPAVIALTLVALFVAAVLRHVAP